MIADNSAPHENLKGITVYQLEVILSFMHGSNC
jgi:hypothetical protein